MIAGPDTGAGDGCAVERSAVAAAGVFDPEFAVALVDTGVLAGDEVVRQNEVAIGTAADGEGRAVDAVVWGAGSLAQGERDGRGGRAGTVSERSHAGLEGWCGWEDDARPQRTPGLRGGGRAEI